jgi:hypothetical protein
VSCYKTINEGGNENRRCGQHVPLQKRFGGKRLSRAASSQIIDQNFVHGGALGKAWAEVKTVL